MKTTATPQEVLAKTYLNISDIQALLGMTREPARILVALLLFSFRLLSNFLKI